MRVSHKETEYNFNCKFDEFNKSLWITFKDSHMSYMLFLQDSIMHTVYCLYYAITSVPSKYNSTTHPSRFPKPQFLSYSLKKMLFYAFIDRTVWGRDMWKKVSRHGRRTSDAARHQSLRGSCGRTGRPAGDPIYLLLLASLAQLA